MAQSVERATMRVEMPGRKKKPTALRVLDGNAGRRPLNKEEPRPDKLTSSSFTAEPPSHLDERAREVWQRLVSHWGESLGVLAESDVDILALHCQLVSDVERITKDVKEEGEITIGKMGTKKNPRIEALRSAQSLLCRTSAELGLTPAARTKVKSKKPAARTLPTLASSKRSKN